MRIKVVHESMLSILRALFLNKNRHQPVFYLMIVSIVAAVSLAFN